MGGQVRMEARGRGIERGGRVSREHERLPGPALAAGRGGRGLFEDGVGVGAADAEGADPGAAGRGAGGPVGQLGDDVERAVREVNLWVRLGEMEAGRDL